MRARVEQRGRRAHEIERGKRVVELDRARLALDLVHREPHCDAHEEALRQLEAAAGVAVHRVLIDQEVTIVKCLQPEIPELEVALGHQSGAELFQVVMRERLVQKADLDAVLDETRKVVGVARRHFGMRDFLADRLEAQRVEQEAGGHVGVGRILFDQRACGQHDAFAHFLHRHAVVQVLLRRLEDALRLGRGETLARRLDEFPQPCDIERLAHAVVDDEDLRFGDFAAFLLLLVRALLRALFAIQHVGARHLVLAAAHQRELDLILDFLDVDRAALGLALHQRGDDGIGQLGDLVTHAR